eukprot:scaffold85949_cov33-Tisochrysis_lutea.AAC.3
MESGRSAEGEEEGRGGRRQWYAWASCPFQRACERVRNPNVHLVQSHQCQMVRGQVDPVLVSEPIDHVLHKRCVKRVGSHTALPFRSNDIPLRLALHIRVSITHSAKERERELGCRTQCCSHGGGEQFESLESRPRARHPHRLAVVVASSAESGRWELVRRRRGKGIHLLRTARYSSLTCTASPRDPRHSHGDGASTDALGGCLERRKRPTAQLCGRMERAVHPNSSGTVRRGVHIERHASSGRRNALAQLVKQARARLGVEAQSEEKRMAVDRCGPRREE